MRADRSSTPSSDLFLQKNKGKKENRLFVRSNGRDVGKFTCSYMYIHMHIDKREENVLLYFKVRIKM